MTTELELHRDALLVVATFRGEVDFANARELGDRVLEFVDPADLGAIVDLSQVRYLDSSGVSLVFRVARSLSSRRQRLLVVLSDDSPLRRLFSVTAVDQVATIVKSVEDAKVLLDEPPEDVA